MLCEFTRLIYPHEPSPGSYMVAQYRPCEKIKTQSGDILSQITAVGYCLPTAEKLRFDMQGQWVKNAKYGYQFKMESYNEVLVPTKEGVIAYLSSGQIKGIGKKTAERIYDAFGLKTLEMLDKDPRRLLQIKGISEAKLKKIVESYTMNRGARDVIAFLAPHIGTTGGIEVAFRNLIYQRYSQDLSDKVKSAMHMKMAKGKYVTHCPYGYMKKPGVKHEMIPDPVAAPIVQQIFHWTIGGAKSTEIAARLNDCGVPTPQQHKGTVRSDQHSAPMWSHQAVIRIIQDYKYTGAMVNFKCENATIRAKVQRKLDKSQWTVVENSHEPLVTHEEYEKANATLRKPKHTKATRKERVDLVYYCGHCGRRLRRTFGLDEYLSCATRMYQKDTPCARIHWSRTDMEKVVLEAYKAHLAVLGEQYKQNWEAPEKDPLKECRVQQKAISAKLEGLDSKNLSLYEQYRAGDLAKEEFIQKKSALLQEKENLRQELEEQRQDEERLVQEAATEDSGRQALKEAADSLAYSDEQLRQQMYGAIDRVVVFDNDELEIEWKYSGGCFDEKTEI
ncbi:recombinase family protein [Oscillospiraceae bacterium 42-9]